MEGVFCPYLKVLPQVMFSLLTLHLISLLLCLLLLFIYFVLLLTIQPGFLHLIPLKEQFKHFQNSSLLHYTFYYI